jgi:hypothetical protein
MTGACPHSIYGAPCDPSFDFAARRATCRRCGGLVEAAWLPGLWQAHRYDARITFWVSAPPDAQRRIIVEDLGASQSGTRPWVVLQDARGAWQVLEETRELPEDQWRPPEGWAGSP